MNLNRLGIKALLLNSHKKQEKEKSNCLGEHKIKNIIYYRLHVIQLNI